jgi:hypothetical protein
MSRFPRRVQFEFVAIARRSIHDTLRSLQEFYLP